MSYKIKRTIPVFGLLLVFSYAVFSLNNLKSTGMTAFTGGTFEASGVVHVPGTDGVLFVDDGRPGEVFWMRLDERGNQAGAVKPVALGINVIDLEGITTDGTHMYVVGSQSKPKGSEQAGLLRFKFDAERQQIEGLQSISGLKQWLAAHVTELRGMASRSYKDGGLNIEGLAWDPQGQRLLLGLRSPVIAGQALVIPLKLRDAGRAFELSNLELTGSQAIRLALDGAGIRSLEYDAKTKAFRLLTGAAANSEQTEFKLWEWNGEAQQPNLRASTSFNSRLKPEGVTRVVTGQRQFTFLVFDTSGYSALD